MSAVTYAMVKRATQEFLSHRGESPERIIRGGYTLWEENAPAMRAALIAVQKMQPPAGETIRSTQDGSMEAAPVTGQSPVDAASPAMVDAFKAKYREFWPSAWPDSALMAKEFDQVLLAAIDAAISKAESASRLRAVSQP